MKEAMKPYEDWIAGIATKDKLVAPPKRWDVDGRVSRLLNAFVKSKVFFRIFSRQ